MQGLGPASSPQGDKKFMNDFVVACNEAMNADRFDAT